MATRDDKVKQRIKAGHARFVKRLEQAKVSDLNEADTSAIVQVMLQTLLGYDLLDDLTQQYRVGGLFADYGIKIDGQLRAFVEVKSANTVLSDRHLRQVEQYATRQGVDWLVLTNGARWQVYHVSFFTKPITRDLVIDVDLVETPTPQLVEELYYLSKESLRRGEVEKIWRQRSAVAPNNLLRALLSAPVLDRIRKELRGITRYNPAPEAVEQGIRQMLREKVLEEMTAVEPPRAAAPRERRKAADSNAGAEKVESGIAFPAEAYAYVRDPSDCSTWKVRLWEDLGQRVTRAQLDRAALAVSEPGFIRGRGRPLPISPDDAAAVRAKIRQCYRLLNIPQDETPAYLLDA